MPRATEDGPNPDTEDAGPMTFGATIRHLRKARLMSQQQLASKVGIDFTYLSKIENDRLTATQFPGEETIRKLARALEADEDELLLLAEKIPEKIRLLVIKHPGVFRKIADLDERSLEMLDQAVDDLLTRRA
jgi:transcriptional regulator with XRE-family HTH domain